MPTFLHRLTLLCIATGFTRNDKSTGEQVKKIPSNSPVKNVKVNPPSPLRSHDGAVKIKSDNSSQHAQLTFTEQNFPVS